MGKSEIRAIRAFARSFTGVCRIRGERLFFVSYNHHDVLQPLNAARLFASALRDSHQNNEEQRHLAERVDASLRAAEELLDGLLDVSRLEAGGLQQ